MVLLIILFVLFSILLLLIAFRSFMTLHFNERFYRKTVGAQRPSSTQQPSTVYIPTRSLGEPTTIQVRHDSEPDEFVIVAEPVTTLTEPAQQPPAYSTLDVKALEIYNETTPPPSYKDAIRKMKARTS